LREAEEIGFLQLLHAREHTGVAEKSLGLVKRQKVSNSGVLCIADASRVLLEAVASWGPEPLTPVFAADDCRALRRGRAHRWARGPDDLACAHAARDPGAVGLCIPMLANGEVVGVLHVQLGGPGADHPELGLALHEQFAGSVAHQVAIAIANLRLRERLRNESIRDGLTWLFNRRYLDLSLDRELKLAGRKHEPVSLLMLDLDHFKTFNDTFGHDAGDAVLRSVGKLLQGRLRSYDIACRYGGEELVIVLPRTSALDAEELANQIRDGVFVLDAAHQGTRLPTVTVSIGVATTSDGSADGMTLLRAADSAWAAGALGRTGETADTGTGSARSRRTDRAALRCSRDD
jgi:diguanylate cyclase (GGDEF)-like protein